MSIIYIPIQKGHCTFPRLFYLWPSLSLWIFEINLIPETSIYKWSIFQLHNDSQIMGPWNLWGCKSTVLNSIHFKLTPWKTNGHVPFCKGTISFNFENTSFNQPSNNFQGTFVRFRECFSHLIIGIQAHGGRNPWDWPVTVFFCSAPFQGGPSPGGFQGGKSSGVSRYRYQLKARRFPDTKRTENRTKPKNFVSIPLEHTPNPQEKRFFVGIPAQFGGLGIRTYFPEILRMEVRKMCFLLNGWWLPNAS